MNEHELRKEIQIVIFRLQNEEFGVELTHVREILRMLEITRIPKAPGFLEGVINVRGNIIGVINLAKQLGLPLLTKLPKSARIMVVETGHTAIGMIVDEVPQVLRIAESDIQEPPQVFQTKVNLNYIQGIAKLGDRLIVLIDLPKILSARELDSVKALEAGEIDG